MFGPLAGANSGAKPLVEFKCGKCSVSGKNVTPEKRKGTVSLLQSPLDGLVHFQWKDRTTGAMEDDLIVFPEEATYKKVKQSDGRVYVFEYKDSTRRLFFWMQEANSDKDEEYASKINQYINNPPSETPTSQPTFAPTPQRSQPSTPQTPAPQQTAPPQQRPQAASQPAPSQPSSSQAVQLSALQNILSGFPMMQPRQHTAAYFLGHHLAHIITPETILPLLSPDIVQRLLPDLPEGRQTEQELHEILRSPQLQQAVQTLSYAIESGQSQDIVRTVGLEGKENLFQNPQPSKDNNEKS